MSYFFLEPNFILLAGIGGVTYMLANKSMLSPPVKMPSLCDTVKEYSEPSNELQNTVRYGQYNNPAGYATRFVDSYYGPYGLMVYEMVEPASGNWVPIYQNSLHL